MVLIILLRCLHEPNPCFGAIVIPAKAYLAMALMTLDLSSTDLITAHTTDTLFIHTEDFSLFTNCKPILRQQPPATTTRPSSFNKAADDIDNPSDNHRRVYPTDRC